MANEKVFKIVTEKIINALENGQVAWQKSWKNEYDLNKNWFTRTNKKSFYRGINALTTSVVASTEGFTCPYWATMKALNKAGYKVNKGAVSVPILLTTWKEVEKEVKGKDGLIEKKKSRIPFSRFYTVFNIEQTTLNDEWLKIKDSLKASENAFNPIETAQKLCDQYLNTLQEFKHFGNSAFYSPSKDSIHMPKPTQFRSPEEYYSTLFHEMIHSTGHQTRCNRKGVTEPTRFGSHSYSQEELVAETGAAFLCHTFGIATTFENSVAYIQGWLKALKDNREILVYAMSQAGTAVNYILGDSETEEESE